MRFEGHADWVQVLHGVIIYGDWSGCRFVSCIVALFILIWSNSMVVAIVA